MYVVSELIVPRRLDTGHAVEILDTTCRQSTLIGGRGDLLSSGDIESNPGPGRSEEYNKCCVHNKVVSKTQT